MCVHNINIIITNTISYKPQSPPSLYSRLWLAVHLPPVPRGGHPHRGPLQPLVQAASQEILHFQALAPQHFGTAHSHPPPEQLVGTPAADRDAEVSATDSARNTRGVAAVHTLPARTWRWNVRQGLQVRIKEIGGEFFGVFRRK